MKFLTRDEMDELNGMLDDVNARPSLSTGERGTALVAALHDAEQAHVGWASMVLDELAEVGAQKVLKQRAKTASSTIVTFKDAATIRSMRVGIRSQRQNGVGFYEQKLFEDITWAELHEHVKSLRQQMKGLGITIATDTKLLGLQKKCPSSRGPGDACKQMGITIEQYLARAA